MIETIQLFFADNTALISWMAGVSVATFLVSILIIPVLISRLPARYFCLDYRERRAADKNSKTILLGLLKNVLGALLVIAGIIMFFIPGQGLLTVIIGLGFMTFPGKYTLERKLISQPSVLNSINWIRKKAGVENMVNPNDA